MTKDQLLKYMQVAYADIEQTVAKLNAHQLTQPGFDGGEWSVKDLIEHLAYWQQREADQLMRARGEKVERIYDDVTPVDVTNRIVYAQNRERPWEDVVNDFRTVHRALISEVERLSDANLADAQGFAYTKGTPLG